METPGRVVWGYETRDEGRNAGRGCLGVGEGARGETPGGVVGAARETRGARERGNEGETRGVRGTRHGGRALKNC